MQNDLTNIPCGTLGVQLRSLAQRNQGMLLTVAGASVAALLILPTASAAGSIQILFGLACVMAAWLSARHASIPIVLIVGLQTAVVYGLPIVTRNEALEDYPEAAIARGATEVMLFCIALAIAWTAGFGHRGRLARRCHMFAFVANRTNRKLPRLALMLQAAGLAFNLAQYTTILAIIPGQAFPIVRALLNAASIGGCLLGGFCAGAKTFRGGQRFGFWLLFWALYATSIIGYLLSSATGIMCATSLGLFIGRRFPPFPFLVMLALVCSFFNLTKFEMRTRYWGGRGYAVQTLSDIGPQFGEWIGLSFDALFTTGSRPGQVEDESTQKLNDRINNLTNLLYVQDAVSNRNFPLLEGKTYAPIPALLIPRAFWPDKPRAHEGQVLLNINFGRQTLAESYSTSIAWGLLPEAYGNFGPVWGALILGAALGYSLGRIENWARPFPISSVQIFLLLAFAVQIGMSFEMVASVFITSTFQLVVGIIFASYPFIVSKSLVALSASTEPEPETPPEPPVES